MEVDSWSPDLMTGGARGLFGGGITPGESDTIEFINIATTGDATDFGNLTLAKLPSLQLHQELVVYGQVDMMLLQL